MNCFKSIVQILLISVFLISSVVTVDAQFKFGVKLGINKNSHSWKQLLNNESSAETLLLDNAFGYQAGLFAEFKLLGFSIEPNVLYARSVMKQINNTGSAQRVFEFNEVLVPINAGIQLAFLKLFVGPVLKFQQGSIIDNISEVNERLRQWQFVPQVGIGIKVKKWSLQAAYQHKYYEATMSNNEIDMNSNEQLSRLSLNLLRYF